MEYKTGDNVFGTWTIGQLLGEGGFGKVYELYKEDFGVSMKSALKVVKIPKSRSDVQSAMSEGMDEEGVSTMYRQLLDDMVKEIHILYDLKNHPNIVRYEDHNREDDPSGIGGTILIKMELLTPFNEYVLKHPLNEADVLRFGKQMADAILHCERKGLIHRDIKPENIFVDELGNFKLGDFGIARIVEKTTGAMSGKGTIAYMAPEINLGKPYGKTVDIYSLGLVMYKLVNRNRLPFYPLDTKVVSFSDRESALDKRMRGEAFSKPADASDELSAVILKACAYHPKDRYQSGEELISALRSVEGNAVPGDAVKNENEKKEPHESQQADAAAQAPSYDDSSGRIRPEDEPTSPIGFASSWEDRSNRQEVERSDLTGPIGVDYRKGRFTADHDEVKGDQKASFDRGAEASAAGSKQNGEAHRPEEDEHGYRPWDDPEFVLGERNAKFEMPKYDGFRLVERRKQKHFSSDSSSIDRINDGSSERRAIRFTIKMDEAEKEHYIWFNPDEKYVCPELTNSALATASFIDGLVFALYFKDPGPGKKRIVIPAGLDIYELLVYEDGRGHRVYIDAHVDSMRDPNWKSIFALTAVLSVVLFGFDPLGWFSEGYSLFSILGLVGGAFFIALFLNLEFHAFISSNKDKEYRRKKGD